MRRTCFLAVFCLALTWCAASEADEASSNDQPVRKVAETLLCAAPTDPEHLDCFKASVEGKRVAWIQKLGDRQCVFVNGKPGAVYDAVVGESLILSPNGRRYLYLARDGLKWVVVVDGKEGKRYDSVATNPQFSPNSARVVYTAFSGGLGECSLVLDGKEKGCYIGSIACESFFAPDSQRTGYWVSLAREDFYACFVVVDGSPGGTMYTGHALPQVIFSPNASRVAYAPMFNEKVRMVVDRRMDKPYESVCKPVFSPDSRRFGYVAIEGNRAFVVVDGREDKAYTAIPVNMPVFSNDGKHVAYVAQSGSKWLCVLDGTEGHAYDAIVDSSVRFSPDGTRLAYTARRGTDWFIVLDGAEGPPYVRLEATGAVFSPDSKRVAYGADGKGYWRLVLDGVEIGTYDDLRPGSVVFSPDSRHVACAVRVGKACGVLLDGNCFKWYDEIVMWGGSRVVFSPNAVLRYLARKENKLFFVEEKLTSK